MVDYKIIKYCSVCKKRFVVHKGQSKRYLCWDCDPAKEEEKK